MTLIDDIVNWGKNQLVYSTGRGLVGLGMLAGMWAAGLGSGGVINPVTANWLMAAAVAGTAAVQALVTYRSERRGERNLITAYREEVGAILGMDPKSVTIENLHDVADDQPEIGHTGNPVIKEALSRNEKRHMMQFVTSALSGLVILGSVIVLYPSLPTDLNAWRNSFLENQGLGFLQAATATAGSMFVAGTGMSIFNQLFDRIGSHILNIHKDSAHDLIMDIRRDIARGKMISVEQVFGVFVAANPELAQQIEAEFGKPFDKLNQRQQHVAMEDFSDGMPTRRLAYELNHYMIEPEELAFAAVGTESGVPKKRDINFREEALREQTRGELVEEVKRAVTGRDEGKNPPRQPADAEVANDNEPGFAERYVPRDAAPKETFVERYAPNRAESQLKRVLAELREKQDTSVER